MPKQPALHSTTQLFLDIYDISNDLLIMKDGAASMILSVGAMNFGLLAEEEQDAIIYAYAGLLNSLNYPIQIVIKSQTKDATKYLNLLKEQEESAGDASKRKAIQNYREFVSNLIRERNVLDKKFYVTIPASALEMGLLPPQTVIPGVKQIDISSVERSVILEKAINILDPKRDHLISQFNRIGLFAQQLTTQEIIQLFYTSYNPEAAEGQQITETNNYTTTVVEAQASTDFSATIKPSPVSVSTTVGNTPMTDATISPNPMATPTEPVIAAPTSSAPTPTPAMPTMTPPTPQPVAPPEMTPQPTTPVMPTNPPVIPPNPGAISSPPPMMTPTTPEPIPTSTPPVEMSSAPVANKTPAPEDPQSVIDSLIKVEPGSTAGSLPTPTMSAGTPPAGSMSVPPATPPALGDKTPNMGVSADNMPPLPEI